MEVIFINIKKHLLIFSSLVLCSITVLGCGSTNNNTSNNTTQKDDVSLKESNNSNDSSNNNSSNSESNNDSNNNDIQNNDNSNNNNNNNNNNNKNNSNNNNKNNDNSSNKDSKKETVKKENQTNSQQKSKFTIPFNKLKKITQSDGEFDDYEYNEQRAIRKALATEDSYYNLMNRYCEDVLEIRDIGSVTDPINGDIDKRLYTNEDFEGASKTVLKILRNEIYARHGYIFNDQKLFNYFITLTWYLPTTYSQDFDESVLNDYERKNIKFILELEKNAKD
ncbi:YARHG domain-containing protein [Lachnobacterium bovis]|uniref:YARHG domain-containing protein n=1 Tax=Lachnobacterium bovis TaxID=140626 RepID=UPI0006858586|nr:YARHG domain-containing protein [Lachnobacterium bovis]